MKRVITANAGAALWARQLAGEFALALLSGTVAFGHERLALIRLLLAVQCGAAVPHEHWIYCERVARHSKDAKMLVNLQKARKLAGVGSTTAMH